MRSNQGELHISENRARAGEGEGERERGRTSGNGNMSGGLFTWGYLRLARGGGFGLFFAALSCASPSVILLVLLSSNKCWSYSESAAMSRGAKATSGRVVRSYSEYVVCAVESSLSFGLSRKSHLPAT